MKTRHHSVQPSWVADLTLSGRAAAIVVIFLLTLAGTRASDSAVQFYFGGFDDVPAGAAGILVADQEGDGFPMPGAGDFERVKLEPGVIIGPWNGDDRIVAVFAATDAGFGSGKTGFTGVVSQWKFDWRERVPAGVPLRFYWFADARPGDRLGKWVRFGTFRRDAAGGSGGTAGFFVPEDGKHEIIAALTPDSPGGGDFDGSTGVNVGLVGIGDFTGLAFPERHEVSDFPADDPDLTDADFGEEFRGRYFGLVSDEATGANLGEISLAIGQTGGFSARLVVERVIWGIRGRFEPDGGFTTSLPPRSGGEAIDLVLQLATADDSGGLKVTGTVRGASGLAGVIDSFRPAFHPRDNPAPWAGRYTLLIPKTEASPDGGDGSALVTVRENGRVLGRFRLGDCAAASDASWLSIDGEWPLALNYGRQRIGSLAGKLTFRSRPECDFDGVLSWSKRAHPRERFFPEGFECEMAAIGSAFAAVEDDYAIDGIGGGWRNTSVSFPGGSLDPNPGTLFLQWHRRENRFEPRISDHERLRVTVNPNTGAVSGVYVNREENSVVRFFGVAFQKQAVISGVANRPRTSQLSVFSLDPNHD